MMDVHLYEYLKTTGTYFKSGITWYIRRQVWLTLVCLEGWPLRTQQAYYPNLQEWACTKLQTTYWSWTFIFHLEGQNFGIFSVENKYVATFQHKTRSLVDFLGVTVGGRRVLHKLISRRPRTPHLMCAYFPLHPFTATRPTMNKVDTVSPEFSLK